MGRPYTYLLIHKPTGRKYYGVRYSQNCDPSDLWVTYFSSSRKVKALDRNDFIAVVRRTFETAEAARNWEHKVIMRLKAWKRDDWLNAAPPNKGFHNGFGFRNSFYGKKHSPKTRALMSETRKGENNAFFGKKHTTETKVFLSAKKKGLFEGPKNPMYGKNHTEESKRLISEKAKKRPKMSWWNDGVVESLSPTCPGENWNKGRLGRKE